AARRHSRARAVLSRAPPRHSAAWAVGRRRRRARRHDWPGNVRELERLIERSVALAATDVIQLDDLPPVVRGDYSVALMPSIDRRETLRAWGGRYVRLVLERCNGNKREACRVLDISYHTLQAYLRQFPAAEARGAGAGWEPRSADGAETPEGEES